ncbi:Myb-like_DNA-binding domain-containing protein [Hexamita inflata]|uniref:Myb-like DNA-binding domain-containing protein n=1 Tax=Hexamita inflata TaxID=28002 RepID=A0AA86P1A7_9EUKA|nr:Myb-like DNA-binding domain-containing protein [Hexamita inflata]CAI9928397.1 Myb-like DNA-binding domain-containing protein [Hexamita inflata]
MKRPKQQWSEEEITMLTQLTESNRNSENGKPKQINWSEIAKHFPNRTENTCKSYYANILKKNLNAFIRKNHQWTKEEIMSLWRLSITYNQDFSFIQNNFMSQFSVKQLQSQFVQLKYRQQKYNSDFEKMVKDPCYAQTISQKQLLSELFVAKFSFQRHCLIDPLLQMCPQDTPKPLDIIEIRAVESFWERIDPKLLCQIITTEQKRRGISDEEVDNVKII